MAASVGERPMPFTYDDLFAPFLAAMKSASELRIGAEAEKIAVRSDTGAVVPYEGERGILEILRAFEKRHGWHPVTEIAGGPVIALERDRAAVTLEPGGQLELSGTPHSDLHAIHAEMSAHLAELASLCATVGTSWLGIGFHPFASQSDLPWVPKLRYGIMRDYLPTQGGRALDMMRRTATIQANFDYQSEEDAMRKMRVALRLSPIVTAMFANSPLVEGRLVGDRSVRARVWLDVDPHRQGLVPAVWHERSTFRDYVEWALDAPMFLLKRQGRVVANTGQPFRSFLASGFRGRVAGPDDWETHLNTLFPEVRLKRTIEVRGADSQPSRYAMAVPAIWTGILYDDTALAEAEALTAALRYEEVQAARPDIAARALGAELGGKKMAAWAERVVEIARGGLARRGLGEEVFLGPLAALVGHAKCPADELLDGLPAEPEALTREVIARTRLLPEDERLFVTG
jgi:glutamate--cysteine ligase